MGFWAPVAFSMLAFTGAAQFALLTTLASGSAVAAVSPSILINARYVVMSVALNDSLSGGRGGPSRPRRWPTPPSCWPTVEAVGSTRPG